MTSNRFPKPCVEYRTTYTLETLSRLPTFYWARMLEYTMDFSGLGLKPIQGVILAGSPGNGRHTIAEALSGTLYQKRKFSHFLRVSGSALDAEDVADVCTELGTSMAQPIRNSLPFCFLLDCPEDSRHSLAIQEFLRRKLETSPVQIFPIIITGSASNILPDLQSSLVICQFERPDLSTRQEWFRDTVLTGDRSLHFEDGSMNHFTLARESEGFTWRQMTDLRSLLRRSAVLQYFKNSDVYKATGKDVDDLIKHGVIKLSGADVRAAITCVRGQGMPTAAPASGAVQYMAAMPAGITVSAAAPVTPVSAVTTAPPARTSVSPAPAPGSSYTEEQKADLKKQQEYHAHPELMSFDDLANIDDL